MGSMDYAPQSEGRAPYIPYRGAIPQPGIVIDEPALMTETEQDEASVLASPEIPEDVNPIPVRIVDDLKLSLDDPLLRIVRPDSCIFATYTLSANNPVLVAPRDENRGTVTIVNHGNDDIRVGNSASITADGNNTVRIPAGGGRDFNYTGDIYVVAAGEEVIDVTTERY